MAFSFGIPPIRIPKPLSDQLGKVFGVSPGTQPAHVAYGDSMREKVERFWQDDHAIDVYQEAPGKSPVVLYHRDGVDLGNRRWPAVGFQVPPAVIDWAMKSGLQLESGQRARFGDTGNPGDYRSGMQPMAFSNPQKPGLNYLAWVGADQRIGALSLSGVGTGGASDPYSNYALTGDALKSVLDRGLLPTRLSGVGLLPGERWSARILLSDGSSMDVLASQGATPPAFDTVPGG